MIVGTQMSSLFRKDVLMKTDYINWEDGAREFLRNIFGKLASKTNLNPYDIPMFIFCAVLILFVIFISHKLDKPLLNLVAIGIALLFLGYFGLI